MIEDDTEPEGAAEPVGLSVAEMAEATGVTGYTLRYYERAGLIRPVTRTRGGQRRYQPADVEWVRLLRRLRETGMPISQIRQYAALPAQGETTHRDRAELLTEHRAQVQQRIKRLREHERALTETIIKHERAITEIGDI